MVSGDLASYYASNDAFFLQSRNHVWEYTTPAMWRCEGAIKRSWGTSRESGELFAKLIVSVCSNQLSCNVQYCCGYWWLGTRLSMLYPACRKVAHYCQHLSLQLSPLQLAGWLGLKMQFVALHLICDWNELHYRRVRHNDVPQHRAARW